MKLADVFKIVNDKKIFFNGEFVATILPGVYPSSLESLKNHLFSINDLATDLDATWHEGFENGKKEGEDEGYKKGHKEGYEAGRQDGYSDGLSTNQFTKEFGE